MVLSAVFPLLTQLLLICLPEKYDVNEEIRKYFESKRERGAKNEADLRSSSVSSVKVKMNIRDGIEEDECLVDE